MIHKIQDLLVTILEKVLVIIHAGNFERVSMFSDPFSFVI